MEYPTDDYWGVICKNYRYHHKGNTSYQHQIALAETDPYSSLPMLTDELAVRCDRCGEEYQYKRKEVLRAEIPVRENFTPHPLFK
jgi:hypothetical protein